MDRVVEWDGSTETAGVSETTRFAGLLQAGDRITFRRVATVARVSTGWLYAQPEVKERITRLRGHPDGKAGPPVESASHASKDAIVRALRLRVGTLDDERRRLPAPIPQLSELI